MSIADPLTSSFTQVETAAMKNLEVTDEINEGLGQDYGNDSKLTLHLLRLPAELRNKIWAYVLSTGKFTMKTYKISTPDGPRRSARPSSINRFSLAPFLVCRQMYKETVSILYEMSRFFYKFHVFEKLLYRQPAIQRKRVRNVLLKIRTDDGSVKKLMSRGYEFKKLFPNAENVVVVAEKGKGKWITSEQRDSKRLKNTEVLANWLGRGGASVWFEK